MYYFHNFHLQLNCLPGCDTMLFGTHILFVTPSKISHTVPLWVQYYTHLLIMNPSLFTKAQTLHFCGNMFGVSTEDSGNIQYLGSNSVSIVIIFCQIYSYSPCASIIAHFTFTIPVSCICHITASKE
jgi:hypothetical protein